MIIKSNEHITVFGKTQSGKSVLVKSFLPRLPRVLFHDRKHMNGDLIQKYHFSLCRTPSDVIAALQKNIKRILYQPTDPSVEDLDEIGKIIFYTNNITLIIDEGSQLLETTKIPVWIQELYRLGMAKGIGVWALSQRSRFLSNICLSEANHIVSFRLASKSDREKVMQSTEEGIDDELKSLELYYFMWYDASKTGIIHWVAPIKI